MTIILGIDPGQKGGLAFVGKDIFVAPMPLLAKEIDLGLLNRLRAEYRPDACVIERPSTRIGEGASNSLTTGINYGLIVGFLRAHGVPVHEVQAQAWKRKLGLLKQEKAASIALAQKLFPDIDFRATERCRTYSDGMAEAALIAHYGRLCCVGAEE